MTGREELKERDQIMADTVEAEDDFDENNRAANGKGTERVKTLVEDELAMRSIMLQVEQ